MIKRLLITGALFSALASVAQTTQPLLQPHQTFVDGSGAPCVGCQLFSYAAGTTTPLATYTDASGGTPNTNPVILDAAGGAQIWLGSSSYKFILKDSLSSTIWTVDNVSGYLGFCSTAGCAMTGPLSASSATISGAISGASETISGAFSAGSVVSPLINSTYYPTSFAQLQANVTTCSTATCTISVTSTVAVTSNTVTPSNVNFTFSNGAQLQPSTGITLTINGPIQASPVRIFGGAGTVVLGAVTTSAPFEWFGAVGDWNGTTGTDNTTTMQACLTALTNGQCVLLSKGYKITAPLTISKSNIGIIGATGALYNSAVFPTPSPSQIITTSSTTDVLTVSGTNASVQILGNRFQNFTMSRSVAPGTSAAGIRLSYSSAAVIDGVTGQDHTACFYFKGVGSLGYGRVENSACQWGYNGFVETSGNLAGFEVDSSGGVASNSLRIRNSFVASNLAYSAANTWITYGIQASGTATHDLHVDHLETANTDYGAWIDGNSAGFFSASDIFLNDMVNDGNWRSSILVRNVDGTVTINGGWHTSNFGGGSVPVIDIENSHHVVMSSAKVLMNGNATAGITANNSNGVNLSHNDIVINGAGGFPAITFGTTSQSVISGNNMNGGNWGTNVITLLNTSVSNTVSNNTIQGTATNGINIDAGSVGIAGLETNAVGNPSFGTITNFINDPSQNGTTVVESLRVGDPHIPSSGNVNFGSLAAGAGHYCLQIDTTGAVSNTGAACPTAGTASALSTTGANGTFWGVSAGTQQWLTPAGILPAAGAHQQLFTVDTGSTAHLLSEANSQINAVFNEGIDNSGVSDMSTALGTLSTSLCALTNPPPLYLPAGTYKINSGWLIGATSTTCGYMTIIGAGAGTILQTDCSGNSYGLWYNNTTNSGDSFKGIRIEHLQIQDTSGTGACQDLLKLTQVARVIVNDVTVSGAKGQVYSTGTVASTGATVTGTGTTWTAAMAHGYLMTTSGTTTTRAEICAVGGATSITLCSNAFPTGNIAGGTSYAIAFAGRGITCDPGNSFSQYISIHDSYAPGNLIGFDAMGSNSGSNGCSRVTIDGSAHYTAQTPGARVTNSVGMWFGRQADTIKVNTAINNVAACYVMDSAHSWQINGECEDNSTYAPVTTCNGGAGTQNCTVAAEVSSDANGSGWSGSFLNMYAYLVGTVYQYDNATGAFNTQILGDRTLSGQYTTHYSFSGATGCPASASGIKAIISTYDCNHQLVAQTVN